ncbi:MAG: carbohydrate-binding domain-containing protein, partial [Fibromonadales bacterium]|nr:carbohydrate-binding domain-containing protein [Fibromonadales bacterium]
NSTQDGIQAATDLNISNATIKVTAGGGSNGTARATNDPSSKGIKAVKNVHIKSGTINIDSKDDGIHADEGLIIDGGTITVATNSSMGSGGTGGFGGWGGTTSANGGDGLRGARSVIINDGNIDITKSYEGIEGFNITINGGTIKVKSSDDGFNVSDYAKSPANGCSANAICCVINGSLIVNGGTIYVDAGTDGLDSNGDITINGGTIVVFGSGTSNFEEAIDADKDIFFNGGTVIALGEDSQCMQHAPKESSKQRTIFVKRSSAVAANTIVNVTSGGNQVVTFRTLRNATRILITSPQINTGTLEVRTGGSHSGTESNMRMFTGGSYNSSGSTQLVSFNVSNMVTTNNNTTNCNSPQTFNCGTSTSK